MHKRGLGARYTRIHKPEKVVYTEEFERRNEAIKLERRIKKFSHNKKKQLINKNIKSGSCLTKL
jgi:putative endonuclease